MASSEPDVIGNGVDEFSIIGRSKEMLGQDHRERHLESQLTVMLRWEAVRVVCDILGG